MDDQPSPAAGPSDALVGVADSKAFRLLLEVHAQEAVERVIKRFLWMLAPVAAVLGFLGVRTWMAVETWREKAGQIDAQLTAVADKKAEIEAQTERAGALVVSAQAVVDGSRRLLLDMQSGMTATAGILKTQGELVQSNMSEATRSAQAQARQIATHAQAIDAQRERIQDEASRVQREVAAVTRLMDESRLDERIADLKRIESVQAEIKRARSLQLVLLTAHSTQTLQMDDPCARTDGEQVLAYELTFTSNGLKGTTDRRGDRVVTIAFDVARPGAEKVSGEVGFADHRGARPFRPLAGTPFEVMLDFRYHYWPFSKDFVALRVRPTASCAERVAG